MDDTKPMKIKTIDKFPSFGDLFERIDTPFLYDIQKNILKTGIFDYISDDFKKTEMKRMDLTQIERQEKKEHNTLLKRWNAVLREEENIRSELPMAYKWLDYDVQLKSSNQEFRHHHEVFNKKRAEAHSAWQNFIKKLSRLYKTEIIDSHQQQQIFDSYFIHVPKVKGASCECTDNAALSQSDSFSIEFIGLGGGGVTEMFQEEGLVTTIENGQCCKIEITVQFLIQVYKLYRLGKLKQKGAWAKPIRIISIAPVTIDAKDDTCGQNMTTLKRKKNERMRNIDTSKFKSGLVKRTLKLTKKHQTKGGISLKVPKIGIESKVDFKITNISEKLFVYSLPRGHVYTYYTVPNAIGYSWSVH